MSKVTRRFFAGATGAAVSALVTHSVWAMPRLLRFQPRSTGLPIPPNGYGYLTGADGSYLTGADGSYLLGTYP